MIPLRDNQPTERFPAVTIALIALNVVMFIAQWLLPLDASLTAVPYELTHHVDIVGRVALSSSGHLLAPGQHPAAILTYGPSPHPLWITIFTSMFMHAGLMHLGGNMLFLWVFGNNIEDALGRFRFVVFYLLCGLAAALLQIATDPNSVTPVLGASGAIAGVLAAYYLLYPRARVLTLVPISWFGFFVELRAGWVLAFWFALQVYEGLVGIGMERGGGVATFAHIGGFLTGLALIQLCGGRRLAQRQSKRAALIPIPPSERGYS
ncbi:rhomboid family intramembrane serine protease [Capsulimonas corticalis]|uniref:Rhomboid family intramembrane serine protease n=1 Tax=Capsulimonas corticalis TaxID=2219043 RepID=A0A402D315_9BACT|nr:rhomboid family intramembrane serine protease [Capsulimonas corticalis]BDI28329.1 rhomboid family intramembrane serine protease [Capsulimonas corticalis]